MSRCLRNNSSLPESQPRLSALPISFYGIGILLAAAGTYLLANGWAMPVKFLGSGDVFIREFKFVDDGDYGSGDGLRVTINRLFLLSLMVTAVLLLALKVWRTTAHPFTGARRIIFVTMSVALSLVSLSAALVGIIMVTRLTINLGVTPKRLLCIAIGMAIVSVFPVFFYATFRKRQASNPRSPKAL